MHHVSVVVTVTAVSPCQVDGFPMVEFGDGALAGVVVSHDVFTGQAPAQPVPVAVGVPASSSFLLRYTYGDIGGQCPTTPVLYVGVPGWWPSIQVSLAPMRDDIAAFNICGNGASVTPFEQGNDPLMYCECIETIYPGRKASASTAG
jgi:hypothetical protein